MVFLFLFLYETPTIYFSRSYLSTTKSQHKINGSKCTSIVSTRQFGSLYFTMLAIQLSKRHRLEGPDKLVWIICIIIGAIIIATTVLLIFHYHRRGRRGRTVEQYQQACSRESGLNLVDEWERRGRFGAHPDLLLEEEMQRIAMIRKSQQSRASDYYNNTSSSSGGLPDQNNQTQVPTRSWSKSWHGRSRNWEPDPEQGRVEFSKETEADWTSVQASVERTWQLLHGKKLPTSRGTELLWNEDDDDAPRRPPTIRLKTPPILSHPIFRDGKVPPQPRHMSLPAELRTVRTDPIGYGRNVRLSEDVYNI